MFSLDSEPILARGIIVNYTLFSQVVDIIIIIIIIIIILAVVVAAIVVEVFIFKLIETPMLLLPVVTN